MFQDFLELTEIFIAGCDIIYGLTGAVVDVIFNPFSNPNFQLSWRIAEIKDLDITNPMKESLICKFSNNSNTMIYEYE